MSKISAKDAMSYAFSTEMLKLYGLFLLADISVLSGAWLGANWALRGGTAGLIGQIIGTVLFLGGLVIGVGAFVGFIYKVIVDAKSRAN